MIAQKAVQIAQVLACDACSAECGPFTSNAIEARCQAYADGWRFPNRIGANGRTMAQRYDDLCPTCAGKRGG